MVFYDNYCKMRINLLYMVAVDNIIDCFKSLCVHGVLPYSKHFCFFNANDHIKIRQRMIYNILIYNNFANCHIYHYLLLHRTSRGVSPS